MGTSFWQNLRQGASPLQDDAVWARLQQAILDDDPHAFRTILQEAHPDLADQHRLYGVLIMTTEGMRPILVDETGQRVGEPGDVIDAGTPIDLLNVRCGPSEITVTLGEHVWTAPYPSDQ